MGISDAIKMKSAQQWSSRQYCLVKYYMFNKFRRERNQCLHTHKEKLLSCSSAGHIRNT